MKIISPSLLNSDTYQIKEQFEALEKCGINYIHIDITDGHFVPMISFGANTVKDLRKHTDFVLDCHLMVENPENLIPVIADAGADIITVLENYLTLFSYMGLRQRWMILEAYILS